MLIIPLSTKVTALPKLEYQWIFLCLDLISLHNILNVDLLILINTPKTETLCVNMNVHSGIESPHMKASPHMHSVEVKTVDHIMHMNSLHAKKKKSILES